MSTSQFGESGMLDTLFRIFPPQNKMLVDVGACGKELSNSWDLLAKGWKGLLIDADPERIPIIKSDFAGLNATIIHSGVSDKMEELDFHIHNVMGHSSFLADWYTPTDTGNTIKIQCRTLLDILVEHKTPLNFDLLTIDIEGMDYKVLSALFKYSNYRPNIIIAECTSFSNPYVFFQQYGYGYFTKTGNEGWGNLIYVRKDIKNE